MTVVLKRDVGLVKLAFAFNVDLAIAIDQDVGYPVVAQQRFERPDSQ